MFRLSAALVALPLLLAGCLGGDDPVEPGATSTNLTNQTANVTAPLESVVLQVATSGIYPLNAGFNPATLSAKEGANVTIEFQNADPNPIVMHDWVLEGVSGAATEAVGTGQGSTISFIAPAAGEYAFFCSVGNHRQLGMEGTFTVTA